MSLIYLAAAEEEALRAAAWYDTQNPGKENDFLEHLDEIAAIIERQPSSFPLVNPPRFRGEFRSYVSARFEYSVIYQVKNGDQLVIAIAHHGRRPNYWTRRLKHR